MAQLTFEEIKGARALANGIVTVDQYVTICGEAELMQLARAVLALTEQQPESVSKDALATELWGLAEEVVVEHGVETSMVYVDAVAQHFADRLTIIRKTGA